MRNTVVFKTNSPTVLGAGYADSYTTLLTTRGYLKRNSGNRSLSFGSIQNQTSDTLFVRYQAGVENNLRSDVKLFIDGRIYTIQTWEKVKERNFYYKIELSSELGDEFDSTSSGVFSDEFSEEFE